MKNLSIPRLEFLAWVLLSKLVVSVINADRLEVQVSQIAVWIKQSNTRWNVWVQNRVEIIRNNILWVYWFHVILSQNLAEIATRSIPLHTIIIYHGRKDLHFYYRVLSIGHLRISFRYHQKKWRGKLLVKVLWWGLILSREKLVKPEIVLNSVHLINC